MDLRTIFEVCAKETEYEGEWRLRNQWWSQKSEERQLKTMLKEILAAAWERLQRESGRRAEGKGGEEESGSGSDWCEKGGLWGLIGKLALRRVTTRCADNPAQRQDGRRLLER